MRRVSAPSAIRMLDLTRPLRDTVADHAVEADRGEGRHSIVFVSSAHGSGSNSHAAVRSARAVRSASADVVAKTVSGGVSRRECKRWSSLARRLA